jgi:oligopeptide transport system ATP-binding protein
MRIGKQITEGMILNGKRLDNKYKKLIHLERMEVKNSVKVVKEIAEQLKKDLAKVKAGESNETAQALKDRAKTEIAANKERIVKAKVALKAAKVSAKAIIKKDWADEKAKTMKDIEGVKAKIDPAHIAKLVAEEQAKLVKVYEEYEQYKTEVLPTLSHEQRSYKKYEFKDKIRDQKQAIKDAKNFYNIKIEELKERLRRFKAVTQLEAFERAVEVMTEVGIDHPEKRFRQYPFQFSGGMRQRIVIAIALTASPEVLICDEPTTALDVTIQAQILELINDLKRERNLSVIFITHDLGVVANMADRIGVMYAGKIVEIGTAEEVFYGPRHPYTWALLSSMPDLTSKERLDSIPGTPPNMLFPPKGDAFADRSKFAMQIDFEEQPPMFKISDTHYAATWLLHKDAPEVPVPSVITDRIERMRTFVQEVKIDG